MTLTAHELLTTLEVSSRQTLPPTAATQEFTASLAVNLLKALSPAAHKLLALVVNESIILLESSSNPLAASSLRVQKPAAASRKASQSRAQVPQRHRRKPGAPIHLELCHFNPITNAIDGKFGPKQTNKQAAAWRRGRSIAYQDGPANPRSILGGVPDATKIKSSPSTFSCARNRTLNAVECCLGVCPACVAYDGAAAQWDAYQRYPMDDRDELILISTNLEKVSCYTKTTIATAVAPFIRFGPEMNRGIWAFLHQVLAEYERCYYVFGGTINRNHDDTMHSVFSPQSVEATKNMKKQIRIAINRLDGGREWAQNIIMDTLLYGTLQSDAGVPINNVHWQEIIDFAFDDSIKNITKDFDALRHYTRGLRERRMLQLQQPVHDAHSPVVHTFDQELPPDEYEPYNKPSTY